ncbi:MAG TPA: GNVR domain-containing protein [Longimicrobiales bacterium]
MRDEKPNALIEFVSMLLRHGRILVGVPLAAMVAAVLVSFLMPARYTAGSRFIPEAGSSSSGRLAGLAAQFGVDIGAGESSEPLDFYVELLESRELLRTAALTTYRFADQEGDSVAGDLVTLLRADAETPDERLRDTVERLEELVSVTTDPESRILTLTTSAPWPELALSLNARLLELVSEFNLERRQSRAAAERRFLETRVAETTRELRDAEATLERFLSDNRRYTESPQLTFEYNRLNRQVELQRQLYTSLAQAFEQARVDEVRNTPVITVLDPPRGPAKQTAPRVLVNGVLGLVLGALLAAAYVLVRELIDGARRQSPEDFDRLRAVTRDLLPRRRGV